MRKSQRSRFEVGPPLQSESTLVSLKASGLGPGAARRHGVLPMPSLEWNEQVAREAAPLYARVQKVVPAVEWPFFAP